MNQEITLTANMRLARIVLAILKPICLLRLMSTNCAANIVVRLVRIRAR